jgi:hypothetical protein
MERVRDQELYNRTFYGNPHGLDNLSPGSMHPYRLVLPEINAPVTVRNHGDYTAIRSTLEEMQQLLVQHQSARIGCGETRRVRGGWQRRARS